jgi:hypothetical protein
MTIPSPRRLARFAALAMVAVVLPLAGAATSQAAYDDWNCTLSTATGCTDDRRAVRSVSAYTPTGYMVGAVASTSPSLSNMVGTIAWDTVYTCKWYDGSRLMYPFVVNGSGTSIRVQGTVEFGSGTSGC